MKVDGVPLDHRDGVRRTYQSRFPKSCTGREPRLKRDLGGAFGKRRYARDELVAELGAVLLGDRLEIGSENESHAAYLGHWIELLKESPRVLFQVLSEARQAADFICPELALRGPAEMIGS